MKNLKSINEFDYTDPAEFENVAGIDVAMTPGRKAVLISIGDAKVELNAEDAAEIANAIEDAIDDLASPSRHPRTATNEGVQKIFKQEAGKYWMKISPNSEWIEISKSEYLKNPADDAR